MFRFTFYDPNPNGFRKTLEFSKEHIELASRLVKDKSYIEAGLNFYECLFEADDLLDFASIFDGETECTL